MQRKTAHSQEKEPFLEKILSFFRHSNVSKDVLLCKKVLDLGCGFQGEFLKKFSSVIASGVGLDVSVQKKHCFENIQFKNHDLNKKLPLQDNMFDVVTSFAVIEHLFEYRAHVSEAFRVLNHMGVLFLTTPAPRGKCVLETLAGLGLISKVEIADHKHYFSANELTELAKDAGFSNVEVKSFQFGFNNLLIARK